MATGAQVWSTTAGSNNSIDSAVNWAEGQAPSSVNDSARGGMASVASFIGDNSGVLASSGSSVAYTVTSKQVSTGVVDGYTITARFHATNDSAATLSVDGVGGKAIQKYAGTNTLGGEIAAGSVHRLTYSSASTSWILNNFTPTALAISAVSATLSSSLDVSGATKVVGLTGTSATLSSSLDVTGATKVAALTGTSATLSSSLDVSGNTKVVALQTGALTGTSATLSSSLEVTKATLLSSALTVTGLITASAGQVSFPGTQNPSSDVNTLDDYEEGTFTPVLAFGGASVGLSYATQLGSYIKVGKIVTIWINITISDNGASTGNATITGLPFTSATVNVALSYVSDNAAGDFGNSASIAVGTTTIDIYEAGQNPDRLTNVELNDGSVINISGSYIASA